MTDTDDFMPLEVEDDVLLLETGYGTPDEVRGHFADNTDGEDG